MFAKIRDIFSKTSCVVAFIKTSQNFNISFIKNWDSKGFFRRRRHIQILYERFVMFDLNSFFAINIDN